ncbi:MAG: preprotein translocase subunit SecY, partial [Eubacteriales bacterium]
PVPFIDATAVSSFFQNTAGGFFGYLNMISGNALAQGTVFALTIQPYINASIIMQLLTVAIPALERLSKDGGEMGRKKINQITRYVTLGIAAIQAYGYYVTLKVSGALAPMTGAAHWLQLATILLTLMAGSSLVMWIGESINEKGVGNGVSIILFASIISRGVNLLTTSIAVWQSKMWYADVAALLLFLAMIGLVVFFDNGERRLPIMYAKRQVGRKMYGGQNTHLPIKVVMTGVMPIIFTYSIVGIPATIAQFIPNSGFAKWVEANFNQRSALYIIITFALIIFFNYFYIAIQYNPVEIANNIKNNGGTIPGIRPGKPTSDFIIKTVNRVTLFGALFLSVIAILPLIFGVIFYPIAESVGGANLAYYVQSLAIGGTSILIIVEVALETIKQIESQLIVRNYKGFLE